MSFESEFLELMPHTVSITRSTGKTAQGLPSYTGGVAKPYRARVTGQQVAVRSSASETAEPGYIMYVAVGDDVLKINDKIDLPSDGIWQTPAYVYSVSRLSDEDGNHHAKVIFGYRFLHQRV